MGGGGGGSVNAAYDDNDSFNHIVSHFVLGFIKYVQANRTHIPF